MTLRTTLVNTLIDVSKDFATKSVKAKAAQLTSDDYRISSYTRSPEIVDPL